MISAEPALRAILESTATLLARELPLTEALGRILAEDVAADVDLPTASNSAVDGYAVVAADTAGAAERAVQLKLLERVAAGQVPTQPVVSGSTSKVLTGANIPQGADAMVMVEHAEEREGSVWIRRPARAGDFVRSAGEELRAGEIALRRGHRLRPPELGLLAAVGRSKVRVIPPPRVAILVTGDELVEPGERLEPGKVRNSNLPTLAGLVMDAGATPVPVGVGRDTREQLAGLIAHGLKQAEVLLTTGGVSMGDFDLIQHLLPEAGVQERFHGVNIKPGKPLFFGTRGTQLIFGLPGNPVSAAVCFEVFVRPALRRLMGIEPALRPTTRARLETPIVKSDGKRHFLRVTLRREQGELWARPTGPQGSHLISSVVRADGLLIFPEATRQLETGAAIEVLPLPYAPISRQG